VLHRLTIALILVCTGLSTLQAQQLPTLPQYREHVTLINPAAVLTDHFIFGYPTSLGISYQQQWINVPQPPSTYLIRADHYTAKRNGLSFGGHMLKDEIGPTQYLRVHGRISGRVGWLNTKETQLTSISAGINFGALQYHIDGSKISFLEPGDFLEDASENLWLPDVGFGLFAYRKWKRSKDILYAGFSVPQVFNFKQRFQNSDNQLLIERNPHYYGLAGYLHVLDAFSYIESSIWARYIRGIWHLDANIKWQIDHLLWFGAGIDSTKNALIEVGYIIDGRKPDARYIWKVSYGVRFNSAIAAIQLGTSHEVVLILLRK